MGKRELGSFGEERAARFLRRKGYKILETNFSCRFGEIDIIAGKHDIVAFVEVKLRKNDHFAEAREFVTRAKQERTITTASFWLSQQERDLQPRFDVIEVYAPLGEKGPVSITHIENAYE